MNINVYVTYSVVVPEQKLVALTPPKSVFQTLLTHYTNQEQIHLTGVINILASEKYLIPAKTSSLSQLNWKPQQAVYE